MIDKRTLRDLSLSKSAALPVAGATSNSAAIDLGSVNPGRTAEGQYELIVELPATPALVDTKTITLVVQDSADGAAFANVADLPSIVSTGAGGVGAAAIERRFTAPFTLRRYIRLNQTVLAAGGDNTAISGSIGLVF